MTAERGAPIRVEVDTGSCIGSGMCASIAPEVFDQDEADGLVRLLDPKPPTHTYPAVREAVLRCPAAAILAVTRPHPRPAPHPQPVETGRRGRHSRRD